MRRCLMLMVGLSVGASWGCGSSDDGAERPSAQGGDGGSGVGGSEAPAGRAGTGGAVAGSAGSAGSSDGEAGEGTGTSGSGGEGGVAAETVTLKVLTLNLPNLEVELAAQDIVDSGADLVGMQEVTPAEVAAICAELGPPWAFVQEDRINTHAIVSRLPILQRIGVTEETRGGIGVSVEVEPGLHAHLFDTHGMWTPYGPYQLGLEAMPVADVLASEEAVRMPGLRELLDLAAPYIGSRETTFLVGDFNAPSHLDYEPPVAWPTSIAPLDAGLVDSYAELHPGNAKKSACQFGIDDPGITWTQLAASEPEGCFDRIDFIYYSKSDANPVESHTIDVKASDHRSVLTTFELTRPTATVEAQPQLPAAAATLVSRHALLTWVPGADALSEELVIGSGAPDVKVTTTARGRELTRLLEAGTTYAWRIDTVTASGTVSGPVRSFTTRDSGGLEPERLSYAPGETITIEFDNADSPTDWIGLYPRASAYGAGAPAPVWKYLNDSATAPQNAVAAGTITLSAPAAAGGYALRFLHADGYAVEDEVFVTIE